MLSAAVLSAVASAAATMLLAAVVRQLGKARKDIRQFLARQQWLTAHALWTERTVSDLLAQLGASGEPPPQWPVRQ